ncbi:MAG: hypothetical protein CMJ75_21700 [Planctomycetaceae bacterium]|nr:hypothetical protein [Planctomycetaceae bacterium]
MKWEELRQTDKKVGGLACEEALDGGSCGECVTVLRTAGQSENRRSPWHQRAERMTNRKFGNRRVALKMGGAALVGLTVPGMPRSSSGESGALRTSIPQIMSFVLVFLNGGLSHIDSFDVKPGAPESVRSAFAAIDTAVPGVQYSEHVPLLAQRAGKYALVRSMSHGDPGHPSATHKVITGTTLPNLPENVGIDKHAGRDDFPCYAAAVSRFRPDLSATTLGGVHLPAYIRGAFNWPGQNGGFLGPRHDPLQLYNAGDNFDYRQEDFRLRPQVSVDRLAQRRTLLTQFDQERRTWEQHRVTRAYSDYQDRAYATLDNPRLADAFDLDRESDTLRERYGKHAFGQSLLLARRLVGAEVPVVQANLMGWDTHVNGFNTLSNTLLPPFDRALAAFLDDMQDHNLLEQTLVVVTGEFGRTPKIKVEPGYKVAGRDHWPHVYSAIYFGGGVQGGQVIGASNRLGAYPDSNPFTPYDMGATIYHAFGIDPTHEVVDQERNRRFPLSRGIPMRALYTAS